MSTTATVVLDDTDVTEWAIEGQVTTRLSGPGTAQVKLPMEHAFGGAGSMLKVYFDTGGGDDLYHHGRVLTCEDSADENGGYTVYNSSDPLELWQWRPVRDGDGDFSNPDIIKAAGNPADGASHGGPLIIKRMLDHSDNGTGDDDTEGPTRLKHGSFANGSVDLTGTPTNWPMTMMELASLLVSTGEVDIVITPIEFDGDANYGKIDVYNGNYGTDRHSTVKFQYGMGAYNVRSLRRNEDMSRMVNKLWYYLGPRKDQQHWQGNVTATDEDGFDDCDMDLGDIQDRIQTSRGGVGGFGSGVYDPTQAGSFDVRMEIRMYDDRDEEATLGYCLFRRLWAIEAYLRAQPMTLVHITPTRDTAIGDFSIGDLVTVEAHADVRGGFSGVQRVYEYTISWDQDSVPAIGELQVSSDNEGFST